MAGRPSGREPDGLRYGGGAGQLEVELEGSVGRRELADVEVELRYSGDDAGGCASVGYRCVGSEQIGGGEHLTGREAGVDGRGCDLAVGEGGGIRRPAGGVEPNRRSALGGGGFGVRR